MSVLLQYCGHMAQMAFWLKGLKDCFMFWLVRFLLQFTQLKCVKGGALLAPLITHSDAPPFWNETEEEMGEIQKVYMVKQ